MPTKKKIESKYKIRKWFNYDPTDGMEHPYGESLTVPDMTLPLKTLLEKYTRGEEVATFMPVYAGEEELPDFKSMTVQERLDYLHDIKQHISDLQSKIKPELLNLPTDSFPTETTKKPPSPPTEEEA